MTAIYPFQTKEVHDLAWACFSPSLLDMGEACRGATKIGDGTPALTPQRQLWLERLDRDASALLAHLDQRPSHRLGIYFEKLWHFFLREDPAFDLVAHNLPVRERGTTLGEFDCIYFCRQRLRHVHLELAVKFYLGLAQRNDGAAVSHWRQWLGPDARDRLDIKMDHLLLRQTRLSEQAAARKQLLTLGIEQPLREIALKGYLFLPQEAALSLPLAYTLPGCPGHWVRQRETRHYLESLEAEKFLILPKMQWFGSADSATQGERLGTNELCARLAEHFSRDNYPPMVAALDASGVESVRFFVTDDAWPQPGPAHFDSTVK